LKLDIKVAAEVYIAVAPLAGAWIETVVSPAMLTGSVVAPLAGAWIETVVKMPRQSH